MLVMLISNFISFIFGLIIAWFSKYFLPKKLDNYVATKRSKEKLREASNILFGMGFFLSQLKQINIQKTKELTPEQRVGLKDVSDSFLKVVDYKNGIEKLNKLKILDTIKPYIPKETWKIFYAYHTLVTLSITITIWLPRLEFVKFDEIEKNIDDHILSVFPEEKDFLSKNKLQKVFYLEERIRKQLLTKIKDFTVS